MNRNSRIFNNLLTFVFFLYSYNIAAQEVIPSTQLWSEIDVSGRISKKWTYQVDFQYSRQSDLSRLDFLKYNQQLTIRPWIHYYPTDKIRISFFAGIWYNFSAPQIGNREYPEYRSA